MSYLFKCMSLRAEEGVEGTKGHRQHLVQGQGHRVAGGATSEGLVDDCVQANH
jgi:hypothetical protein